MYMYMYVTSHLKTSFDNVYMPEGQMTLFWKYEFCNDNVANSNISFEILTRNNINITSEPTGLDNIFCLNLKTKKIINTYRGVSGGPQTYKGVSGESWILGSLDTPM